MKSRKVFIPARVITLLPSGQVAPLGLGSQSEAERGLGTLRHRARTAAVGAGAANCVKGAPLTMRPLLRLLGTRLPKTEGTVRGGVRAPVTIHRDGWGVPYIEAQHSLDAFFALGFV